MAILISSMAKRIPTQLRGPIPNPMKAYGFRLALFSGLHLKKKLICFDDSCLLLYAVMQTFQDRISQDRDNILPCDEEQRPERLSFVLF